MVAAENEDGLVLMANEPAAGAQLLGRLQKAAPIKFKLSGSLQIVGKLGDDGQSGNIRRVETTLKLWSNAVPALETTQEKEACVPPPQYIAAININCAVPVNLITFLVELTFMFLH